MKKLILILSALFVLSTASKAQTLGDVVRYSNIEVGGTARSVGVGGAIGALGADFSVLSTNPAGAAAFRRSEFTFTPTFERSSANGLLTGGGNAAVQDAKANFNFNNIGIVFSGQPRNARWRTAVFGIGINRMANFHQTISYEGTTSGSITDRWWELAGDLAPNELDAYEAGLAFDTEALYGYDPTLIPAYLTDFLDDSFLPGSFLVDKSQLIERKGSINELVFTYAGNYDEKLMIGATLGIPIINYEETKTYEETDETDRIVDFEALKFTERLKTTGGGVNLKVGVIYRLNQMARLGAAIHTPTGMGLTDAFSTSMEYQFNGERREEDSPEGSFEYRMRTPWRLIGSGGIIVKKTGFLSAEVEYVNYTSAKFNFNNTNNDADLIYEDELNGEINNDLTSAINIRLGGEYAMEDFRFRAGYAISGSPYADNDENNGALSLGAGYRGESFFIDVAYKRLSNQFNYQPYLLSTDFPELEQSVSVDEQRNRFMLTLGFKL